MMKTTKNLKVNDLFTIVRGRGALYIVTGINYRPAGTGHGPSDVYPAYYEVTAAGICRNKSLGREITFRNGTKEVNKLGRAKVKTLVTDFKFL
jgi:hypothetical protein